jgi:hypothetical protein
MLLRRVLESGLSSSPLERTGPDPISFPESRGIEVAETIRVSTPPKAVARY